MSRLWNEPGVPHKGWHCIWIWDIAWSPSTNSPIVCKMCENTKLQYFHVLRHTDYPRALSVCCACATKMEQDPSAAKAREEHLRRAADPYQRLLTRKWKSSQLGNPYLCFENYLVTVFPDRAGRWRYSIKRTDWDNKPDFSRKHFGSVDDAQRAALDHVADLLLC